MEKGVNNEDQGKTIEEIDCEISTWEKNDSDREVETQGVKAFFYLIFTLLSSLVIPLTLINTEKRKNMHFC